MATTMTEHAWQEFSAEDLAQHLASVAEGMFEARDARIQELERKYESLKALLRAKESPPAVPYSDDELDAVRDREREHEWERSTDRYDRGARD